MSRHPCSEARRALWMILGLLAIPALSVTSAALIADIASTTDPAAALVGIPATLGGVVMGAFTIHFARSVRSGATQLWQAVRRALRHAGATVAGLCAAPTPVVPRSIRPAIVPGAVGRRGPPFVSR